MLKKVSYLVLFAGLLSLQVSAAEKCSVKCDSSACSKNHYFIGGVTWIDNEALTPYLSAYGIGEYSTYNLNLGYGAMKTWGRFVHGLEINTLLWKKNTSDNYRAEFWAARVLGVTGYEVVKTKNLKLFPYAGLGMGMSSISITAENMTFTDALNASKTGSLHLYSVLINLGAGFDFYKPRCSKTKMIGIRGGYVFDPIKSNQWYKGNSKVKHGPDIKLSGPYVNLVIGHVK
jgi:opacity protein-like surface antigen